MSESGKKQLNEDGVVIKKRNSPLKNTEEEISIDALDSTKRGNGKVDSEQPASTNVETEKMSSPLKLLETLSEEEVKALLDAKGVIEEQVAALEEKNRLISEYEDLLKRKQAEFENFRKRVVKESEDYKKYAVAEMALDIITVIDNFERALEAAESSKDFNALHEGILMIEKQLKDLLEKKYEVKMIETVGKEFNPNLHDALMMEESEEYGADTVVEDFQKGYIMHDRVIRPAKVKVAKAMSSTDQGNSNNNDENEEE
jgi:molecular chaperone GrpE